MYLACGQRDSVQAKDVYLYVDESDCIFNMSHTIDFVSNKAIMRARASGSVLWNSDLLNIDDLVL